MAGYTGVSMDIKWLYAAGTTSLSGDYRSLDYTPSIDMVDQSAGADTNKTYITALKDGRVSLTAVFQSGNVAGGTAMAAVLAEGNSGTLIWSPEGTAATKPKYTIPAISMGASFAYPYNDLVVLTCDFQQNGARTEGTN